MLTEEIVESTEMEQGPFTVSLADEEGNDYTFQVIDDIEFEGNRYLIALPDDGQESQIVAIKVEGDDLTLVQDETELGNIEAYLNNLPTENLIDSVTLVDDQGQEFTYQVVESVEIEGETYLLATDPNSDANEVIAVRVAGEDDLQLIEDEQMLARIQDALNEKASEAEESMVVTLEDENGNTVDFQIVGKMEIKGAEYFLAASPNEEELVAIKVEGEQLVLIKDEATLAEINVELSVLRDQLQQQAANN